MSWLGEKVLTNQGYMNQKKRLGKETIKEKGDHIIGREGRGVYGGGERKERNVLIMSFFFF